MEKISSPLRWIETDNGEEAKRLYKKMYGDLGFADRGNEMSILNEYAVNGDLIINVKLGDGCDVLGSIVKEKTLGEWTNYFEYYSRTILNYSILPITGGINIIKRQLGNDRLDTFINALNKYYGGEDALILNSGAPKRENDNCKILNNFLQSFETVYNFFAQTYGFNNPLLVNSMIKSGSKAIITEKDLGNYLKLAVVFWNKRFDSMLDNKVIRLNDASREKVYEHFRKIWAGIENDLPGTDTTLK